MKRSTDRILTTHAGSLPRPDDLFAMIKAKQDGGAIDAAAFAARVAGAVADTVRRQADAGIDIVEHPERIGRFAKAVGRENVIAGADCGFASFAATCEAHPSVVWVKLQALAEGAGIASRELWR